MANEEQKLNKKKIQELIALNQDAKQYFFSKADEKWLDWLWDNGFLDVIKTQPEDPTVYGYRTPEVNYIAAMAKVVPEKVIKIILDKDTATTEEKFRPELVDQFLRMGNDLPAKQLALVIPKIHKQKWVRLMNKFSHWGFEYERMFKVLSEKKDYKSILLLAETVLEIRTKENLAKTPGGFTSDNPFYLDDLSYTKVFEYMLGVPEKYSEKALEMATRVMSKIVVLGGKSSKEEAFSVKEVFYLFDVDFFSLELDDKKRLSYRDDVRELAAVIKILITRLIEKNNKNLPKVRTLYKKYINSLPESRAMWRLRLYVLSLHPKAFSKELKESFFRLFDKKVFNYTDIISGTEYEEALKRGFHVLSAKDRKEYIDKVISYFRKKADKDSDQNWHMRYGSDLLSMIISYIDEKEKQLIKEKGFLLDPDHKPTPSVSGPTMAGFVSPQGPVASEEFGKLSIDIIAKNLRSEWSPVKLKEKYQQGDDFYKPHNAEGVGNLLQADIQKRLQEYVNNAELFFERDVLDQHYTYSFFRGVEAAIKNSRGLAVETNWDNFIELGLAIEKSAEASSLDERKRERGSFDGWLSNWTSVHSALTDVIQILLREEDYKTTINFEKHRDNLFKIIGYLLKYPDPVPSDEEQKTAKITTGNEHQVSDPFTTAINSVRGRAFQALQLFIFPDGRILENKNKVVIKDDVKKLYESVLERENTRALMFMFGHYLPSFYFRDIAWLQSLLPKIFPKESAKKYLYLAAWEGYLSNNLYQEIFFDPNIQELYQYALTVDIADTGRRYFRDPDQGMATHLALAFVYYKEFYFDHPLFKAFWGKNDPELHSQFVSFIGRAFVSGSNAGIDEFLRKEPMGKERIKEFWDWILSNYDDPRPFAEFGFWISLGKDLFEPVWLAEHLRKTLEKSKGAMEWDYGITKCVAELSQVSPKDMTAVARLHFFEGQVKNPGKRFPYRVEPEWMEVFKILYANPDTKEEIYNLIDDLIRDGGSAFWSLKEIISENK